jgi:fructuronate reductase
MINPRLSQANLGMVPNCVRRPGYDRAELRTGIVHLGIGAFHRAHQAVLTETVLNAGDLAWGITAASLRSPETRDALAPQDNLYTLVEHDGEAEQAQIVGAITSLIVAPETPETLIRKLASPETRLVTLTVTEKGYCHDPATGQLNEAHPDIRAELAQPQVPRTMPGFLLEALWRRRQVGLAPFTILSCDNLPSNGRVVKQVIQQMAEICHPEITGWIDAELACPSSMVDRIVPATTEDDRKTVSRLTGLADAWPVMTEPFLQWVIEDAFPSGRPAWEIAGAELTADVRPFETMKLRLLNGAHSSMAYLGLPLGHEMVADAVSDPLMSKFLDSLWSEIIPSVPAPPGTDLWQYCERLRRRFANPTIRHRLAQIAMDGSQKLPQRLMASLRDNAQAGRPFRAIATAIAAFALHASGQDSTGRPIEVRDPLAAELALRLSGLYSHPEAAMDRFLAMPALFTPDFATNPNIRAALSGALAGLVRQGVATTLGRI